MAERRQPVEQGTDGKDGPVTCGACSVALENLDRGGLPRAVRSEESEHLAVPTSKSMPRTASTAPYRMRRSRTSIAALLIEDAMLRAVGVYRAPRCVRVGHRRHDGYGSDSSDSVSSPRPRSAVWAGRA